jgi:hypothetical protein
MPILFRQEDGFLTNTLVHHDKFLLMIRELQRYTPAEQEELIEDNIPDYKFRQYIREYLLVEELKKSER